MCLDLDRLEEDVTDVLVVGRGRREAAHVRLDQVSGHAVAEEQDRSVIDGDSLRLDVLGGLLRRVGDGRGLVERGVECRVAVLAVVVARAADQQVELVLGMCWRSAGVCGP